MDDRLIHKNCSQMRATALCGSDLAAQRSTSNVICIVCDELSLMYETGAGPCPICQTYCGDANERQ